MQKNEGFATSVYFIMNDPSIRNYGTQSTPSTAGGQVWVARRLATWDLVTELDQTPPLSTSSARFISRDLISSAVEPGLSEPLPHPLTSEMCKLSLLIWALNEHAPSQLHGDTLTQGELGRAPLLQASRQR